jgi:selenocysteine lyase/cysteine desulfurase
VRRKYWDAVHYGDVRWGAWSAERQGAREKIARFIGADPEEVAFVHSTSEAMNLAADLLQKEGGVLANTLEFPSSTVPWLHRGIPVRFLEPRDGVVSVDSIKEAMDAQTKILVSSFVQYGNGFRQDLEALGAAKSDRYLVVNATQGFGALPIDVRRWKADFLCAASYKWFLAGYGGGIFYVNKKWLAKFKPSSAGWRSRVKEENFDNRDTVLSPAASRAELGSPGFPVIFAMGAAVDYLQKIGIEAIEERILELTDYAIERLTGLGLAISSPRERKYRSGIVVFKTADPGRVASALIKKGIFVSPRGEGVRVAPHFYNNFGDIDRLVKELKSLIR